MKIGFPNNPRKDIIKEIEWIGKNKFDFVDLYLEEDAATPEKIDVKKVKNALKKYKLEAITGHTAWYLPIGSPIKSIRTAAILESKRYFEVFSKLGVKFVTIHANWPGGMFSPKAGIKFQVDSLKKLVLEGKKAGIEVMYEPTEKPYDSFENVSKILHAIPKLHLHLDIGHANLYGNSPEEFIKKFHKRLKHVHMHDNDGYDDLHLPMGAGNIDWKTLIPFLKKHYNKTITLEVFSNDKDFVLLSRDKLKKLWRC